MISSMMIAMSEVIMSRLFKTKTTSIPGRSFLPVVIKKFLESNKEAVEFEFYQPSQDRSDELESALRVIAFMELPNGFMKIKDVIEVPFSDPSKLEKLFNLNEEVIK